MEEQKRRRERKSAAYWLSKSSILYPICILYVMYVKQVEVYITELSVHVSAGTMLFAYALCLILWLASPIRSYCADGTGNEILFHAFLPNILMLFFVCSVFTENCVVSCCAGWDVSYYGSKRFA